MEKKLRVAAYCRVSTDKDEQLNSLDSQRHYFSEYIRNHSNWSFVHIFYDEGISGTQTTKRVGFNQMIEEAFRGNIDLILTKEVSRFARNTVDTLSYTRKLKDCGVGVIFTIDNIDTREPDGELRLTIMASIAQEESRKTAERVKWGQKRRMEQGVVFGRDLLGYTVKNGELTIHEEEARIVRTIFHKYTNEGKGTHTIGRELIEEGMHPKRVALWSNTVLLRMLRNEKYVGDLCQKKTITPNYLTHKKKYNRGEEEMIYISNHHEPIIDRKLWNRTQDELQKRSQTAAQKEKYSNRYWCSGKLYCGICGRRFVSRTKKCNDGTIYKAWRCFATARHGRLKTDADGTYVGCENQSYNEKALLTAVQYAIGYIQDNFKSTLVDLGERRVVLCTTNSYAPLCHPPEVLSWKEIETPTKTNLLNSPPIEVGVSSTSKIKDLKKEIIREIKKVQQIPEENTHTSKISKLKEQIENCHEKKRKVLDLLLSDLIDMEEVKKQNAWYDEKIEELEKQLFQLSKTEEIRKHQAQQMEEYLLVLDEIMDFVNDTDTSYFQIYEDDVTKDEECLHSIKFKSASVPKQMYKEVLDKMLLYPEGKITVFLNGLPFAIQMKIQTSGRMEQYRTEILEMEIVKE